MGMIKKYSLLIEIIIGFLVPIITICNIKLSERSYLVIQYNSEGKPIKYWPLLRIFSASLGVC